MTSGWPQLITVYKLTSQPSLCRVAVVAFLRQSNLDGDTEQMERQSNRHNITPFRRMMANRLPRSLLQAVLLCRAVSGTARINVGIAYNIALAM